ncbi:MAG TPA: transposase [Terracidiphilus sp.]|nr:transposase [Terracidiphilus sp.]
MPEPKRYQRQRCFHFITFSCYQRMRLLSTASACQIFEETLERVRRWYGFSISGYVVMPEHVHLLVSEPERSELSVVLQMLKQITSRKLRPRTLERFWQVRYYDFPVWSEKKMIEKLRYIHRNPVNRGLVQNPQDWPWSSFLHHAAGSVGVVEVESRWTAAKRERVAQADTVRTTRPSPKPGERAGQPLL